MADSLLVQYSCFFIQMMIPLGELNIYIMNKKSVPLQKIYVRAATPATSTQTKAMRLLSVYGSTYISPYIIDNSLNRDRGLSNQTQMYGKTGF